MTESKNKLKDHQLVLEELLREFDRVCQKYNIKYILFAGTALGAVRHKGIIPWDDDLDIVMMREEYEKFLQVAPTEVDSNKYFVQKEFSQHWPMCFSKLRKNNTACLERFIPKDKEMHQGIYLDIFPCDNLSDYWIIRKLQFFVSKLIIAKSLGERGYLTDSIGKKIVIALSALLPKKILASFVQKRKCINTCYVHTFFGGASKYEKNIFPREWISEIEMMEFGRDRYPVSRHYDAMLTKLYGDYMILPTEDEKKLKVHAELVDTENSYEFYINEQENFKFNTYTRSIR